MKPLSNFTPERSLARHDDRAPRPSQRTAPRIDCHFHAPAEDAVAVRTQHAPATRAELRAFRQLSTDYLDEKNHRGYLVDFAVYALLTGLCVWSLIELGILVFQAMTA